VVAALTLPAVGQVIPTFIEVRTPETGSNEPRAETDPESVCALNDRGFCVPPLGLDQAAEAAGGIEKLVKALVDESTSAAVGRSMGSIVVSSVETVAGVTRGMPPLVGPEGGPGAGPLLATIVAVGTGVALARGAYLAASPEARLQTSRTA
jgi:hypothetical protein